MIFASALSTHSDAEEAVHDVIAQLHAHGPAFDFATIFYTSALMGDADSIAQTLIEEFDVPCLVGVSCEGVVAGATEIESGTGLSVMAGRLPGVRAHAFHVGHDQWEAALSDDEAFGDHFGVGPETRAILAMGDPWSTPINPLLTKADAYAPHVPLIGGIASGARHPKQNVLMFNDARFDNGMVGISLSGAVNVETVVSQGCRPIGRPLIVTRGANNIIETLGGKPALTALEELVNTLSDEDKKLLGTGLLIGSAISEYKETFARGDFLVRSIIGVDEKTKSMGVGDRVRVGQTVQFHVRDAATAHEDLNLLLTTRKTRKPAGALLFTCNGRGTRLFTDPHHDAQASQHLMPGVPLAGFFAAGEIGPVAGRNFIHGHTASFALFSPVE